MKKLIFTIIFALPIIPHQALANRVWDNGFEASSTTAGIEIESLTGTGITISATTVRSGVAAVKVSRTGSAGTSYFYNSVSGGSGILNRRDAINVAVLPSVNTVIIETQASGNTGVCGIYLGTDGKLNLYYGNNASGITPVGNPSLALSLNTWYSVGLSCDVSDGVNLNIEMQLNGSSIASASSISDAIQYGSVLTEVCDGIDCGSWAGTGGLNSAIATIYFDDIAVNDNLGGNQTGFPTWNAKLIALKPNAAGDNNLWAVGAGGTAGIANNYTRVQEITPDGLTTYNASTTINGEDLYNMDDSGIGASDTVNVVQVGVNFAGASATSEATFKVEIEKTTGGTIAQGTAITPNSTTFKTNANSLPWVYTLTRYTDPDGSAWTQATLDSMQAGMKVTTTGTNADRVTKLWAYVDYTPAAVVPSTTKVFGGTLIINGSMILLGGVLLK